MWLLLLVGFEVVLLVDALYLFHFPCSCMPCMRWKYGAQHLNQGRTKVFMFVVALVLLSSCSSKSSSSTIALILPSLSSPQTWAIVALVCLSSSLNSNCCYTSLYPQAWTSPTTALIFFSFFELELKLLLPWSLSSNLSSYYPNIFFSSSLNPSYYHPALSIFKFKFELLLPWFLSLVQAQTQAFASLVYLSSSSSSNYCYLGLSFLEFELNCSMSFPFSPQIWAQLLYVLPFLSSNLNSIALWSFPLFSIFELECSLVLPSLSSPRAQFKLLFPFLFPSSPQTQLIVVLVSLLPLFKLKFKCYMILLFVSSPTTWFKLLLP
jgi:hypothetical protein